MSLQPGTFDLTSATKELAEAERVCNNLPGFVGVIAHQNTGCEKCGGTGRIVLFPALRVDCGGFRSQASFDNAHYHRELSGAGLYLIERCRPDCRGWVAVSDPRVACWEAEDVLIKAGWNIVYDEGYGYAVTNAKGHALVMFEPVRTQAVIRAGLAWVKEKYA